MSRHRCGGCMDEIGRRAVSWVEQSGRLLQSGAVFKNGHVVVCGSGDGDYVTAVESDCGPRLHGPSPIRAIGILDVESPSTLGCLTALMRDVWGDPHAEVQCNVVDPSNMEGPWEWHVYLRRDSSRDTLAFDSEGEAIVAALEAAP